MRTSLRARLGRFISKRRSYSCGDAPDSLLFWTTCRRIRIVLIAVSACSPPRACTLRAMISSADALGAEGACGWPALCCADALAPDALAPKVAHTIADRILPRKVIGQ